MTSYFSLIISQSVGVKDVRMDWQARVVWGVPLVLRRPRGDLVHTICVKVRAIIVACGRDAPQVALHSLSTGAAT